MKQCPTCGLYVGKKPHTGPIHDRIRANRERLKRALSLKSTPTRKHKG